MCEFCEKFENNPRAGLFIKAVAVLSREYRRRWGEDIVLAAFKDDSQFLIAGSQRPDPKLLRQMAAALMDKADEIAEVLSLTNQVTETGDREKL